jgi:cobalt-precorrin-5B (C1)-methyltransferase
MILSANTARHAFDCLKERYPEVIDHVGHRIVRMARGFAAAHAHVQSVIFDYSGNMVFDSNSRRPTRLVQGMEG